MHKERWWQETAGEVSNRERAKALAQYSSSLVKYPRPVSISIYDDAYRDHRQQTKYVPTDNNPFIQPAFGYKEGHNRRRNTDAYIEIISFKRHRPW